MEIMDEDKLIKLPILKYYDENIKKWIVNKISSSEIPFNEIVFSEKANFPIPGVSEILYIDVIKKNIYIWDDTISEYNIINTGDIETDIESITKEEIEALFI